MDRLALCLSQTGSDHERNKLLGGIKNGNNQSDHMFGDMRSGNLFIHEGFCHHSQLVNVIMDCGINIFGPSLLARTTNK